MRARAATAVAVAAPLALAADTLVAMERGWRPATPGGGLALAGAAVFALVALLAPTTREGRGLLAHRAVLLALIGVALGFTAAEAVLGARVARAERASFHLRPPGARLEWHPDPAVLPGISPVARYTINSRGLRGPELPDDRGAYRILCVGASSTECFYLDDEKTWPHLVMTELPRTWVGAAGMSGFGCVEHARFIEEAPVVGEMDAVLLLVGVNDLSHFLRGPPPESAPRPAPFWARSRLLGGFFALADGGVVPGAKRPDPLWSEDATGSFYAARRRLRQRGPVSDVLPDLAPGLVEYRACIERIVAAARRRRVRPIFATDPAAWSKDLSAAGRRKLWYGWLPSSYLSVAKLAEANARYEEALLDVCRELGVECIDLRALDGREELFYDDCHFTDEGARRVAGAIAAWLGAHPRRRAD